MTWRDPPLAELLDTGHDPTSLARDWITLWQSEMAALSVDREAQETWRTLMAMWADAATAMLRAVGPPPGYARAHASQHERDGARPAAPPRAAAADAAPDAGDAADGGFERPSDDRLARRVADLERRLAALERSAG